MDEKELLQQSFDPLYVTEAEAVEKCKKMSEDVEAAAVERCKGDLLSPSKSCSVVFYLFLVSSAVFTFEHFIYKIMVKPDAAFALF